MEILMVLLGGLKAIEGFLILFFVPGFVISLVFFPRFTELGLIRRLFYSLILSTGSGIASLMFTSVVLGKDTASGVIIPGLEVFSSLLLIVWLGELWYLNSSVRMEQQQKFSLRFRKLLKYLSPVTNSRRDSFTTTTMARVVWHENVPSGTNQVDHTYLIDVGDLIDIQQVDENRWKFSDGGLLPPPCPKTRNFALFIRESREDGLSLIDDLQIYPVRVTRKPGVTFLGHTLIRGALVIKNRLYQKTDTAEIQWIYTHDFHLFAFLYPQDTLNQMVVRVLIKLDEITVSIHQGSRVSSHVEETQKLRDESGIVQAKPRRVPTITEIPIKYSGSPLFSRPIESDRRKLQADIVRDLKVDRITSGTFRGSDRMITSIKIPDRLDLEKILSSIKEIQNDAWLYE